MDLQHIEFEALVHAYNKDLYRYAYWQCKSKALAEDMVQETFMRAWKALDKLENIKAAKAWLFTILRRELARHYQRNAASESSLEEIKFENIPGDEGIGDIEHFNLNRAIKALPDEYREPLLLQVIGGYSCDEIAKILDIKPGAVMTRAFRAKQKLRQVLLGNKSDSKMSEISK